MTLGCGGYGGNITSDNISPRHLLNIKRLAYEVTQVANRFERGQSPIGDTSGNPRPAPQLPAVPPPPAGRGGIPADVLTRRIDQFLGSRGYRSPSASRSSSPDASAGTASTAPLDFVCEEDVRAAINGGRKLVVSERAIITPAARDLAEEHRVFTVAPWRG
jgi:hypothetical protein